MENKLEQLLNSLIKRWRVPFGEWYHRSPYKRVRIYKNQDTERTNVLFYSDNHTHWKVLRQVVSRESLLWQFVCENGMIKPYKMDWIKNLEICSDKIEVELNYWSSDYEAWLMESSLKDEEELEQFLLDNIKIWNE